MELNGVISDIKKIGYQEFGANWEDDDDVYTTFVLRRKSELAQTLDGFRQTNVGIDLTFYPKTLALI